MPAKTLWNKALERGEKYIAYARALDEPAASERIKMPQPKPPLAARPTQLSVTDIENWLRDPYTIYAKHVLRLYPLEAVDTAPGAADRGTIIHGAIGDFAQKFPKDLPRDAFAQMQAFGEKRFAEWDDFPDAKAFWWPRFLRVARWLTDTFEPGRRAGLKALHSEIYGKLPIPLGAASFILTARADRIEQLADGSFAIIDYKTGKPPSDKQVMSGLSPQLTLEAAMLRGGAFAGIAKGASVSQLVYVALRGGEPPGEDHVVKFKDSNADAQADNALKRLAGVAARFTEIDTAYRPLAHPMWANALRRLRPPRAREGMVADRRRRRGRRMSKERVISEAVLERQRKASDPDVSAWVSANAGSGKTHVLAQRVIRLMLSGIDPAKILCITFTKAAAGTMANRVFDELRTWTAFDDAKLIKAMKNVGARDTGEKMRARARKLFALALETPGGLKVQTIHAFCTHILHLFPFEANVAARFSVLDEAQEAQLLDKMTNEVLARGRGTAGERYRARAAIRRGLRRRPHVSRVDRQDHRRARCGGSLARFGRRARGCRATALARAEHRSCGQRRQNRR